MKPAIARAEKLKVKAIAEESRSPRKLPKAVWKPYVVILTIKGREYVERRCVRLEDAKRYIAKQCRMFPTIYRTEDFSVRDILPVRKD